MTNTNYSLFSSINQNDVWGIQTTIRGIDMSLSSDVRKTLNGHANDNSFVYSLIAGCASFLGSDAGAWNPAVFGFPAYKHLLLGGLAFGIVFMITDPVSSPGMNLARWIYGAFAGLVTIVIRTINPAYPEGVMLAILMANVFAPLIDYYVVQYDRKRSMRRVGT